MICPPPPPFISWAVRCNQYIPMTIQCQFSRFPFGKWCCITFSCHIWTKAVPMSISQSVKVPLNGSATIWCLNSSSQSCISCKIPEGHSAPSSGSFIKVLNSIDPSTNHRGAPLVSDCQDAFCAADDISFELRVQPVLSTPHCQFISSRVHWFTYEEVKVPEALKSR